MSDEESKAIPSEDKLDEEFSPLVGTSSELAPGVGGVGDHPAPAVMRDPATGFMRQHGEGPLTAGDQSPIGDTVDRMAGDGLDPEAREKLHAEHEPDQIDIDRSDIGTP
jgi:hypothetical protein